ncbi:hypothetical protein [Bacillus sp. FSL R12-0069]|uniref:hypothetical protein n=1 Tax=Bacillus sp. FSL R12-0069 TaxID=2975342 RepID=UPI0030FC221F
MLKQKMMKVALCGAIATGVVGSFEAVRPSQASAAMVEGNFGLVNMKGSATVVSIDIGGAIDSAINHVKSMSAESTQERINIVSSFLKSLDQKLGNKPSERKANVAIVKATNQFTFLKPYIPGVQQGEAEDLHLYPNSQTYTIKLAGENYIVTTQLS